MTASRNVLPLLLDTNGKPKESFKEISTDDLRLGLIQLIDGLERMGELLYASNQVDNNWRDGRSTTRKAWDKEMQDEDGLLVTTQVENFAQAGDLLSSAQWMEGGKPVIVSDMGRDELRKAILESFDALDRFRLLSEAVAKDASRVLSGLWVQSEGDKASFRSDVREEAEAAQRLLEASLPAPSRPRIR